MSRLSFEQYASLKLLLSIEGIGPGKLKNLLIKFKTIDNILSAGVDLLTSADGISNILAHRIRNAHLKKEQFLRLAETEYRKLDALGAKIITVWDNEYPAILKKIYDPPLILYILGSMEENDRYSVAVVGTRKPTAYGKQQAEIVSSSLAKQGITVISGMARGIDSVSHKAALDQGGRSIAVIGSGLDVIYPPENRYLFQRISENGAVISEYEPGTKPDAQNFPRRNRIISGLSLGIVVIETQESGGAMQTAAYGLDQGREVFAVPGQLNSPQSSGTNLLIQKGEAKLIRNAGDVLVELEVKLRPETAARIERVRPDINLFEEKILQALGCEPLHIDIISENAGMNTSDCLVYLLSLEFKGLVRQLPGKMFELV